MLTSRPVAATWLIVVSVALLATAAGAQDPEDERDDPAAVELVERYAPIIAVKPQSEPCDTDGEQYLPAAADMVLDNPHVALRQIGVGNPVLVTGPSASDIHDMGEAFFIDFPGDAFDPGCLYERDFQKYNGGRDPVVYAHIANQADRPDRLAVQYWFFYYYNKYNNLHEGDWEGIQILFEVGSIDEALTTEPESIGYSQHFGGEIAGWDDAKLERDGTHPVVYPAVGSHASYFEPTLYLGRSVSQGFGCDTTIGADRRLEPDVVLLPDRVDDPNDPLAWIMFEGLWGELRSGPFSGATGPVTKPRWDEPVDWHETLRSSSVAVPGGTETTTPFVNQFCTVVGFGSQQYLSAQQHPFRIAGILGLLGAAVWFLATRTEWNVVNPLPVVARRRLGQIVTSAARLYWSNWKPFLRAAALYFPLVTAAAIVTGVVGAVTGPLGWFGSALTAVTNGLTQAAALITVSAAMMLIIAKVEKGEESISAVDAYRQAIAKAPVLFGALIRAAAIVVGLAITVIGIPWAIRQYVRYQVATATIVFEDQTAAGAIHRCSALIRGRKRWWHTALVVVTIQVIMAGLGALAGLAFLIAANGLPLGVYPAITSAAGALVLPYLAATTALLYGNVVAESRGIPAERDGQPGRGESGTAPDAAPEVPAVK